MLNRELEIKPGAHSVLDLWPFLETLIKNDSSIREMQASSDDDQKAFETIIAAMDHMHRLGCEARNLNWYWPPNITKKAHLARDTGNVFEEHFGATKLPPVAGVKSLKYIHDIILPFMIYTASLKDEWWVRLACNIVSINFEEKITEAVKLVGQMSDMVRSFENARAQLRKSYVSVLGQFAPGTGESDDKLDGEVVNDIRPKI